MTLKRHISKRVPATHDSVPLGATHIVTSSKALNLVVSTITGIEVQWLAILAFQNNVIHGLNELNKSLQS